MTKSIDLRQFIRDVPDLPEARHPVPRRDAAPRPTRRLFRAAVDALAAPFQGQGVDRVLGIESRGFIFGRRARRDLDTGLVPSASRASCPGARRNATYELEYGTDKSRSTWTLSSRGPEGAARRRSARHGRHGGRRLSSLAREAEPVGRAPDRAPASSMAAREARRGSGARGDGVLGSQRESRDRIGLLVARRIVRAYDDVPRAVDPGSPGASSNCHGQREAATSGMRVTTWSVDAPSSSSSPISSSPARLGRSVSSPTIGAADYGPGMRGRGDLHAGLLLGPFRRGHQRAGNDAELVDLPHPRWSRLRRIGDRIRERRGLR